jgi:hypothetical protein
MLTISKNLVWPRDLESFKGGNFNTLSLWDTSVHKISRDKYLMSLNKECQRYEKGHLEIRKMKIKYMLFSYQTGYIMWHSRLMIYIPWGAAEGNIEHQTLMHILTYIHPSIPPDTNVHINTYNCPYHHIPMYIF